MFSRIFALVALVSTSGCGSFIGKGLAPNVTLTRPVSLDIAVAGDQHGDIDDAVNWIVRDSRSLHRAKGGGDARVRLIGTLTQKKAILAGTDSTWTLEVVTTRDDTQVMHDAKSWTITELNSNVPYEVERLIAQSVVWGLERSANALANATPPEAAFERPSTPAPVAADPDQSDTPPLAAEPPAKKSRKKR